ncbi:elongation factor G [Thermobrachium celere]|uniref:Elongation factor G n=1 Tax=Thermobrachium celere DSM 8682 TaxID=941824 RepID=R7RU43_9CLOT|nr:elongation factor G [Thermobrachium celere]GFR34934.1 elongation factor G [Thermobrachium celere]CDF58936.1 Translation elongation factor G-related protein [Thermobrachium celere DSM 8682]
MKEYKAENVRNIGLIGHGGTGKTSLAEAILFSTKESDRLGRTDDGTSILDYDPEEKKRKISISSAVANCLWNGHKIYLVDTPGYFDFVGEVIQGLKGVDAAIINVCGVSGLQVGTEKSWDYVNRYKIPRAFFINKLDRENSNYEKTLQSLKDKFGLAVVPIEIPIGKEADFKGVVNIVSKKAKIYDSKTRAMTDVEVASELMPMVDEYRSILMEAVAETDEELLDKYLSEGELSEEEIVKGLRKGILSCDIAPVFCGSAVNNIGIHTLLDNIINYFPSPLERTYEGINPKTGNIETRKSSIDEAFSAIVFKTIADPFVGRLSLFRVLSGSISADSSIYNSTQDKMEKVGTLYLLKGKNQISVDRLYAGEIGAVSKLQYTLTGDTLCDASKPIVYGKFEFPEPCLSMTVKPKAKGDEDKISTGLQKLLEEDPTFRITRDVENAETIISGLGEMHIEIIANKLKNKFGIDVVLDTPKVPYRETIRKSSDVQGKYKKQTGGHGQYGDVWIKFEPQHETDDLIFVDQIVGGVVPRQYIPAVEKGLREAMKHGVLAGYPVIGIKATLHDGSYHPVDSSEMAFKTAAALAYKKGMKEADPVLLEPIMHVEITIPDEYMGDVMGDINKRRGRVLGMEQRNGLEVVTAEIPLAEMFKYATELRSMTQARGSFTMRFERYEEVPPAISQKIIENAQKLKEMEEE